MVLNRAGDDVVPLALTGESYPLYSKVVRFCATTGKDNFLVTGADELGSYQG